MQIKYWIAKHEIFFSRKTKKKHISARVEAYFRLRQIRTDVRDSDGNLNETYDAGDCNRKNCTKLFLSKHSKKLEKIIKKKIPTYFLYQH